MIRADSLTRTYGEFKAVENVSFNIDRGEVVGLLGHNGAGKTTIMKMLTGYLEPSLGSATIHGFDVVSQRRAVQQYIGYLPENCPLYPEMTVVDYLEYQAALHGVPESRRPAALRSAIDRTELGPKAADPIATLSRGYRQRVGVAQAILHQPQILILDEPTNGLDPAQIQHMRTLLRELSEQATVIVSTHILQEVQAVCDRVLILRNGHMALDAKLGELEASRRLLVAVDRAPERATPVLQKVDGVRGVEYIDGGAEQYRYALSFERPDPQAAAPEVARAVLDAGWALYGLRPELRDLETVFGEINNPVTGEAVHA
ncbi:MAG: ABC transporter ATP-binding protein [Gammaproteobacteria bacterium]